MMATILDPRTKILLVLSPHQREVMHDELMQLMIDFPQDIQQSETDVVEAQLARETPPTSNRLLLDCFRGDIMNAEQRVPTSSELEMEAYLCESVHAVDRLDWWTSHNYKSPRNICVFLLRRYYLRGRFGWLTAELPNA